MLGPAGIPEGRRGLDPTVGEQWLRRAVRRGTVASSPYRRRPRKIGVAETVATANSAAATAETAVATAESAVATAVSAAPIFRGLQRYEVSSRYAHFALCHLR